MFQNRGNFTKRQFYFCMGIVCAVAVIVCVVILLSVWWTGKESYETYNKLRIQMEDIHIDTEAETVTTATDKDNKLKALLPDKSVDFQMLRETNEDIYAYIFIPNTNVDYPIVQHLTDDSFYLNHNLDLSKGYPGTIYTERCNNRDFNDVVTLVYGHNMLNGTMFATLHNYEEEEFFEENRYVFVYTPAGVIVYEIFAAVTYSDEHIMNTYDFEQQIQFEKFIKKVYSVEDDNAHFREDIVPSYEDDILVLSTCCSNPDKRYIVCAVKRGMVEDSHETE